MFLMQLCLMEDGQKNTADSLKYTEKHCGFTEICSRLTDWLTDWLAGCLVGYNS